MVVYNLYTRINVKLKVNFDYYIILAKLYISKRQKSLKIKIN